MKSHVTILRSHASRRVGPMHMLESMVEVVSEVAISSIYASTLLDILPTPPSCLCMVSLWTVPYLVRFARTWTILRLASSSQWWVHHLMLSCALTSTSTGHDTIFEGLEGLVNRTRPKVTTDMYNSDNFVENIAKVIATFLQRLILVGQSKILAMHSV